MKHRNLTYAFALFALTALPTAVYAQELSNFQGLTDFATNLISQQGLVGFFNNLFSLALAIGSSLAVIIIATAGLQYMTTDAVSGKKESVERIRQAVLGLIMLLGIWLFFNQINPDILKLNFLLPSATIERTTSEYTPYTGPTNRVGPNAYGTQYQDARWTPRSQGCAARGSDWVSADANVCGNIGNSASDLCCALPLTANTTTNIGGTTFYTQREIVQEDVTGMWCYQDGRGFHCATSKSLCDEALARDGGAIGARRCTTAN